jgi:alpha-ketoglutarate-dependent taurine dioxygenase
MTSTLSTLAIDPIGRGDGVMITATEPGTPLRALSDIDVEDLLARSGHIVFRGFAATGECFNEMVLAYSSRITLDPARVFQGNAAQKVDSGKEALGLHIENGATPFIPDLLWFFCEKAAAEGSQTTVCDGVRVWERLSDEARETFTYAPISYSRTVPRELWQKFAAYLANDSRSAEDMHITDLYDLTSTYGKAEFVEQDDGSLHYEFTLYGARQGRLDSRMAWANSIFGPSFNYDAPDMRLADGKPIPEEILEECRTVTEAVTEEIAWQDRDLVLIDNSRVMHGRRAIVDENRSILNAQSFAR